MKYTIYYSVNNGGDGSAYPVFFLNQRCADIHQDLLNEFCDGWGEDCTGEISFDTEGPVIFDKHVMTTADYIKELEDDPDGYGSGEKETDARAAYIEELKSILE